MSQQKILFVHNALISFVAQDLEILQDRYQVEEYFVKSNWLNPWRDFWKVYRADLIFGWFASAHTLFPVLFAWILRKPSVIVLGGYDVANVPEINYGHQRGGLKKWLTRLIFKAATLLLPVSQYNYKDAVHEAGISPRKLSMVYNGINLPVNVSSQPKHTILTVGKIDQTNLERKGLNLFVKAARLLPDLDFQLVGGGDATVTASLKESSPPNVNFAGQLAGISLVNKFSEAVVYVQPSKYESFGLSVAEAMSYGCIPVLSRAGALPEVGGDCAVYLSDFTPQALADAITHALEIATIEPNRAEACRQWVKDNFTLDLRRQKLYELLEPLLNKD